MSPGRPPVVTPNVVTSSMRPRTSISPRRQAVANSNQLFYDDVTNNPNRSPSPLLRGNPMVGGRPEQPVTSHCNEAGYYAPPNNTPSNAVTSSSNLNPPPHYFGDHNTRQFVGFSPGKSPNRGQVSTVNMNDLQQGQNFHQRTPSNVSASGGNFLQVPQSPRAGRQRVNSFNGARKSPLARSPRNNSAARNISFGGRNRTASESSNFGNASPRAPNCSNVNFNNQSPRPANLGFGGRSPNNQAFGNNSSPRNAGFANQNSPKTTTVGFQTPTKSPGNLIFDSNVGNSGFRTPNVSANLDFDFGNPAVSSPQKSGFTNNGPKVTDPSNFNFDNPMTSNAANFGNQDPITTSSGTFSFDSQNPTTTSKPGSLNFGNQNQGLITSNSENPNFGTQNPVTSSNLIFGNQGVPSQGNQNYSNQSPTVSSSINLNFGEGNQVETSMADTLNLGAFSGAQASTIETKTSSGCCENGQQSLLCVTIGCDDPCKSSTQFGEDQSDVRNQMSPATMFKNSVPNFSSS